MTIHSGLAQGATGQRRQIFGELAAVELRHAAHWADKLTELGEPVNYSSVGRPRCWSSGSDT